MGLDRIAEIASVRRGVSGRLAISKRSMEEKNGNYIKPTENVDLSPVSGMQRHREIVKQKTYQCCFVHAHLRQFDTSSSKRAFIFPIATVQDRQTDIIGARK
jgi:hypothetical protein